MMVHRISIHQMTSDQVYVITIQGTCGNSAGKACAYMLHVSNRHYRQWYAEVHRNSIPQAISDQADCHYNTVR